MVQFCNNHLKFKQCKLPNNPAEFASIPFVHRTFHNYYIMSTQQQKTRSILALCVRDNEHESMQTALSQSLHGFHDWAELIQEAEHHGMAPLLNKHLSKIGAKIPQQHQLVLQSLYLRHRRANTIRKAALLENVSSFPRSTHRLNAHQRLCSL